MITGDLWKFLRIKKKKKSQRFHGSLVIPGAAVSLLEERSRNCYGESGHHSVPVRPNFTGQLTISFDSLTNMSRIIQAITDNISEQ